MHCLYCKKRLWLFFSKKRVFCSKVHETAYHEELSAMNRLREFTLLVEQPTLPAPRNRKLSEIYRESQIQWALSAVVPLCNFAVDQSRQKPVTPDPATVLLLGAVSFVGSIQFPSSQTGVIAIGPDSVTEPAREITAIGNEGVAACRVHSKRSRRLPARSPAAFSLRTHRRRLG